MVYSREDFHRGSLGNLLGDTEEKDRDRDDGSKWEVDVETYKTVSATAMGGWKGSLLHRHV